MNIFSLKEVFEFFVNTGEDEKLVRIEIFESNDNDGIFRMRVWFQDTYNLYPTFLNIGKATHDWVYASEIINQEISLAVAPIPEWLTGIRYPDIKSFYDDVYKRVHQYLHDLYGAAEQ